MTDDESVNLNDPDEDVQIGGDPGDSSDDPSEDDSLDPVDAADQDAE